MKMALQVFVQDLHADLDPTAPGVAEYFASANLLLPTFNNCCELMECKRGNISMMVLRRRKSGWTGKHVFGQRQNSVGETLYDWFKGGERPSRWQSSWMVSLTLSRVYRENDASETVQLNAIATIS
jgi:hypothetical protein